MSKEILEKVPLLEVLDKYLKDEIRAYHTPGHKQGKGIVNEGREILQKNLLAYDLTEVPGLDDLHNPEKAIKEAEERVARAFGSEKAFFLVNGSSGGIQATFMALFHSQDEVIIPRNSHRSVYTGLIYSGAVPRYIYPQHNEEFSIYMGITLEEVIAAFRTYPKATGIVLINPNYYGITNQLKAIVDYVRSIDKYIIVDEAHGAHFSFSSSLPISAMEAGADISIQSTHKNLTSMTQSSLLHVKSYKGDFLKLKEALRLVQTSSPSYPLMLSLDMMGYQMESFGQKAVACTRELALRVRADLEKIAAIKVFGERDMVNYPGLEFDPTKITINLSKLGITGYQADRILRQEFKVQVEMADYSNIVVLLTIGDTDESGEALVQAIQGLVEVTTKQGKPLTNYPEKISSRIPQVKQILTPREAWFKTKRSMPLQESAGQVLGEEITPYPPGIPLAVPGEVLTSQLIKLIEELKETGAYFQGIEDPNLRNIRILDSN